MGKFQTAMQNMFACGKFQAAKNDSPSVQPSDSDRIQAVAGQHLQAPHPIPPGSEGKVCPISGLFADETEANQSAAQALDQLENDPDIVEERKTLMLTKSEIQKRTQQPALASRTEPMMHIEFVPLNVVNRAHKANSDTRKLVRMIGGLPTLRRFTTAFYKKAFVDPHLDQFIRKHSDPHGERFASWVAEKLGDGTPWTDERRTRPSDVMQVGRRSQEVAFDRSSAHFAAWHSPKRAADKWGEHFKPDDARVWMRLHFWAARETGLFEPENAAFMDYYIRFIGHFISIYSGKAPPFARESARWSADPQNIEKYLSSGNHMSDVIDKPVEKALAALPADERVHTGSGHPNPSWPYNRIQLR